MVSWCCFWSDTVSDIQMPPSVRKESDGQTWKPKSWQEASCLVWAMMWPYAAIYWLLGSIIQVCYKSLPSVIQWDTAHCILSPSVVRLVWFLHLRSPVCAAVMGVCVKPCCRHCRQEGDTVFKTTTTNLLLVCLATKWTAECAATQIETWQLEGLLPAGEFLTSGGGDSSYLHIDLDWLPLAALGVGHALRVIQAAVDHRLGVSGLLLQGEAHPSHTHGAADTHT